MWAPSDLVLFAVSLTREAWRLEEGTTESPVVFVRGFADADVYSGAIPLVSGHLISDEGIGVGYIAWDLGHLIVS